MHNIKKLHELLCYSPEGHLLRKASESYIAGFLEAVERVYGVDNWEWIARRKFGVAAESIDEEAFLAHASELSVQNGIAQACGLENFSVEKRVNPPKDVDCYFEVKGTRVSIDVKCAHGPITEPDTYVQWTAGRLPRESLEKVSKFRDALSRLPNGKRVSVAKKKDNSLKDFLVSANREFDPNPTVANFNAIIVGCRDPFDLMTWHNFLYARGGLFTRESFKEVSEYRLVDAVILSNLKDVHSRREGAHCWSLENVFLLPLLNPFSKYASVNADDALSPFNHHLRSFRSYCSSLSGGKDGHVLEMISVLHYIEDVLPIEERLRYFGPRKSAEEASG